jgi:murein DD-endopeptidase MepM/ murein hydrolase activator NlpD
MKIIHHTSLLCASALLLVACTQEPAPFAHHGDQFFGRGGAQMAANRPIPVPDYQPPVQTVAAPLSDMTVTQLAAPEPINVAALPDLPPQLPPIPQAEMAQPQALEPLFLAHEEEQQQQAVQVESSLAPTPSYAGSSNFIWPVEGQIVSQFGRKDNGLVNDGINISAREGEPIWAAASGEVIYAGNELKGYGNMLILSHAGGYKTVYAHASDMLVRRGDKVKQGDLIGYVGQTGAVNSAQLHFGIRDGKSPINPESKLPRRMASAGQ